MLAAWSCHGLFDPEVAVLEESTQATVELAVSGVAHRELERVLHDVSLGGWALDCIVGL
jgi:hypothetical protein